MQRTDQTALSKLGGAGALGDSRARRPCEVSKKRNTERGVATTMNVLAALLAEALDSFNAGRHPQVV
eukprot:3219268-Amphidinium_carterae.1